MTWWSLPPAAAATAALICGAAGLVRTGPPRGRLLHFLAQAALAVHLGSVAWLIHRPVPEDGGWAGVTLLLSSLAFGPLWIAFAARFGRGPSPRPRLALLWLLAALVLFGWLGLIGLRAPQIACLDLGREGVVLTLESPYARIPAGLLLLAGAFALVRLAGTRQASRLAGLDPLTRALRGPAVISLGVFLFASQSLLYGALALQILGLVSLGLIPAAWWLLPAWTRRSGGLWALSDDSHPRSPTVVLMGLGFYLIGLAALGQIIDLYFPRRELVWFHWGGLILLGVFSAVWAVPSFRQTLLALGGPGEGGRIDPRWEWQRVNQLLSGADSLESLRARLEALSREMLEGSGAALWVRDQDGWFRPVGPAGRLPRLAPDNPLVALLSRPLQVADFSRPPADLDRVPAYVENQEMIERHGVTHYAGLQDGGSYLGILGLAPRSALRHPDLRALLECIAGQVTLLLRVLAPAGRAGSGSPSAATSKDSKS